MHPAELMVGLPVNLDGQQYVITALNASTQQARLRPFQAKATTHKRINDGRPTTLVPFDEILQS